MSHIEEQDHPPGIRLAKGAASQLDGVLRVTTAWGRALAHSGRSVFKEIRPE
jgi:hypothetical protein